MDSAFGPNRVFKSPRDDVGCGLADAGRDQEQHLALLGQCVEVSRWLVDEAGELHGSKVVIKRPGGKPGFGAQFQVCVGAGHHRDGEPDSIGMGQSTKLPGNLGSIDPGC